MNRKINLRSVQGSKLWTLLFQSKISFLNNSGRCSSSTKSILTKLKNFIFLKQGKKEYFSQLNMLAYNKKNLIMKTWDELVNDDSVSPNDIAETFKADETVEAGDILVMDSGLLHQGFSKGNRTHIFIRCEEKKEKTLLQNNFVNDYSVSEQLDPNINLNKLQILSKNDSYNFLLLSSSLANCNIPDSFSSNILSSSVTF